MAVAGVVPADAMNGYPKGVKVAESPGPLEPTWALTTERRRQDEEARYAWARRTELNEATTRGEKKFAELERQIEERVKDLVDQKVSFVFAGTSEGPVAKPAKAGKKGAALIMPARVGVTAAKFDVTPRGTAGVVIDKAAKMADRLGSPEVQVRVRLGEAIAEGDEAQLQSGNSRRRRGSRPHSATPTMASASGRGSPTGSLVRPSAQQQQNAPLDGPEHAVWQGNNTEAMIPGAGVGVRIGNELRRGPTVQRDPTRNMTRAEYLSLTMRDSTVPQTPVARPPPQPEPEERSTPRGADAPREPDWMDDAKAVKNPTAAEQEEQELAEWYGRGRGKHYAFEKQILEKKAGDKGQAWGDNSAMSMSPPVPVVPRKNSRQALLSQAATRKY